jgi:nicotinamidase-related amidase
LNRTQTAFLIIDVQDHFLRPRQDDLTVLDIGGDSLVVELQNFIERLPPDQLVIHIATEPMMWLSRTACNHGNTEHYIAPDFDPKILNQYGMHPVLVKNKHHLVSKTQNSGFHENQKLASLLEEYGIRKVQLAGLNTDVCVLETAADAARLGLETEIILDLCRDPATGADLEAREARLLRAMQNKNVKNVGLVWAPQPFPALPTFNQSRQLLPQKCL